MEMLLLCHGMLRDDSAFEVGAGQVVQYRGNFGTDLYLPEALALVQALLSDANVSERQIGSQISGYRQHEPLEGPGSFGPDVALQGDDQLLCFAMDLASRRWLRLGTAWQARLGMLLRGLGQPLHLNLVCCTALNTQVAAGVIDPGLQVGDWVNLMPRPVHSAG